MDFKLQIPDVHLDLEPRYNPLFTAVKIFIRLCDEGLISVNTQEYKTSEEPQLLKQHAVH